MLDEAALALGFVVQVGGGGHYELRHLPAAGGLDDQDARLLSGLQTVAQTRTAVVREWMATHRSTRRE